MDINKITIGNYPCYDPPEGVVGINRMVMRTGASRCGRGAFVMLRRDYDVLAESVTAQLVMAGDAGPGLEMTVVVGGAEPIAVAAGSDPTLDLVRVTVYDQRAQNTLPIKKYYNVMRDGFPLNGSSVPVCFSSTLNSSNPWTWEGALKDATILDSERVPVDLPSWKPFNLIWDNVPIPLAMDDVAAQLFYVVGFDHQTTLGKSLRFFAPAKSAKATEQVAASGFQANVDLARQAEPSRIGGVAPGDTGSASRNYHRLPGKINVVFPGIGDADPFSSHRTYTKTITTGFGASDYSVTLNVGSRFAAWSGSAWTNQSDLDSLATDLAARAAEFISQVFGQVEYAGIWPFRPDGKYRQVEWVSDDRGARTIVSTDNAKDWLPGDSLDDPINLVTNQEVIGLGSSLATIGTGGTKFVYAPVAYEAVVTGPHPVRGGCYLGALWKRPAAAISMATATAPGLGEIGSADSGVIVMVNKREISKPLADPTQWDIDVTVTTRQPHVFDVWFAGYTGETPPRPCYLFDGRQSKNCS